MTTRGYKNIIGSFLTGDKHMNKFVFLALLISLLNIIAIASGVRLVSTSTLLFGFAIALTLKGYED